MTGPKTPSYTTQLLQRAHSPTTAARILSEKIIHKPLQLTPTTGHSATDARAARRARREAVASAKRRKHKAKNKPAPLSANQKRALCVHELTKDELKFDIYLGLSRMWAAYIRAVLGMPRDGFEDASEARAVGLSPDHAGPLMASADLHGAFARVVRSGCVSRVGLEGVVVRETKFTIVLVTRTDEGKTVPKEGTVFRLEVPLMKDGAADGAAVKPLTFEIHGDAIQTRAPERAGKKFKMHLPKGL